MRASERRRRHPPGGSSAGGQALCLVVPAITQPGELATWWASPVLAGLASYYALWARYLFAGRDGTTLYRPLWALPVPMAVLPVVVFLSTAAWLSNPWIAVAAGVLAVGQVPASVLIERTMRARP